MRIYGVGVMGLGWGSGWLPGWIQTINQGPQFSLLTLSLGVHFTLLFLQMTLGFMRETKHITKSVQSHLTWVSEKPPSVPHSSPLPTLAMLSNFRAKSTELDTGHVSIYHERHASPQTTGGQAWKTGLENSLVELWHGNSLEMLTSPARSRTHRGWICVLASFK